MVCYLRETCDASMFNVFLLVQLFIQALHLSNNGLKSLPRNLFKMCLQLSTLDLHGTEITMDLLRQVCSFFSVIHYINFGSFSAHFIQRHVNERLSASLKDGKILMNVVGTNIRSNWISELWTLPHLMKELIKTDSIVGCSYKSAPQIDSDVLQVQKIVALFYA